MNQTRVNPQLNLRPSEVRVLDMLVGGFTDKVIGTYFEFEGGAKSVRSFVHQASRRNGAVGRKRLVFLYRMQRAGCLTVEALP